MLSVDVVVFRFASLETAWEESWDLMHFAVAIRQLMKARTAVEEAVWSVCRQETNLQST